MNICSCVHLFVYSCIGVFMDLLSHVLTLLESEKSVSFNSNRKGISMNMKISLPGYILVARECLWFVQ